VHHGAAAVEGRLAGIAAADGNVAVEDLLECLDIGDKSLPLAHQPFQDPPCVVLVRVVGPDQVHRNIGIDQDHDQLVVVMYPCSISASMVSTSGAGKEWADAFR